MTEEETLERAPVVLTLNTQYRGARVSSRFHATHYAEVLGARAAWIRELDIAATWFGAVLREGAR